MQYHDKASGWCHFWTFDSLEDMLDEVSRAWERCQYGAWARQTPLGRRDSNTLGKYVSDMHAARKLAATADDHAIRTIERMIRALEDHEMPKPVNIRRVASWSEDHGDEVCVDRLRAGQAYWRSTERHLRAGPQTVTVLANLGASKGWSPEQMLWRAAAGIVLTHLLEAAGYRVELWGGRIGDKAYTNGSHQAFAVKLKDAGDPLDISTVVNAGMGWFYRTFGIASLALGYEKGLSPKADCGASAGVCNIGSWINNDKQYHADSIWSEERALEWIKNGLKDFIEIVEVIDEDEEEAQTDDAKGGGNQDTQSKKSQKPKKVKRYADN